MKAILVFVMSLTGFVRVWGTILPSLPMGSEREVLDYCLRSGNNLTVFVYQFDPITGQRQGSYAKEGVNEKYLSKTQVEESYRRLTGIIIQELISNNFGQRMDDVFECFAVYSSSTFEMEIYLEGTEKFSLQKIDGKYTSPDLSGFKMGLPDVIPYRIKAKWIRSVTYDGLEQSTSIDDSRIGSDLIVKLSIDGSYRIDVPKGSAIGAGSRYNIRVSAFIDGQFIVYKNGLKIDENLPKLRVDLNQEGDHIVSVSLEITSGEVGRTYRVLTSTNLRDWVDTGNRYTVGPYSQGAIFTMQPSDGAIAVYKLLSVEAPPEY